MNKIEQRLTIAAACGWVEAFPAAEKPHPLTKKGGILLPYTWINTQTEERIQELPDYLNDLNAMHVAETYLDTKKKQEIYATILESLLFDVKVAEMTPDIYLGYIELSALLSFSFIRASATQRAEAFLRTLNLWKDE